MLPELLLFSLTSVPIVSLSLQISYGPVSTLWLPVPWVYEESFVSVHPSLLAHWVDVIWNQNPQNQFRLVGERMKEGTIRPWKDYDLKGSCTEQNPPTKLTDVVDKMVVLISSLFLQDHNKDSCTYLSVYWSDTAPTDNVYCLCI